MRIAVLGATGRTGRLVVEQALAEGHTVMALARGRHTFSEGDNLVVVTGDATDGDAVARATERADAVVVALGANSSELLTKANQGLIAAGPVNGFTRVVEMSSMGVEEGRLHGLVKILSDLAMGKRNKDKIAAEALLARSELDYTVVRCSALTDDPRGSGLRIVPTSEKMGMKNKVARADVADFMLRLAVDGGHSREAFVVSR